MVIYLNPPVLCFLNLPQGVVELNGAAQWPNLSTDVTLTRGPLVKPQSKLNLNNHSMNELCLHKQWVNK